MACCKSGQGLLVEVGEDAFTGLVDLEHVEPMTMRDTLSNSWVKVSDDALIDEVALRLWINRGLAAHPPKRRS